MAILPHEVVTTRTYNINGTTWLTVIVRGEGESWKVEFKLSEGSHAISFDEHSFKRIMQIIFESGNGSEAFQDIYKLWSRVNNSKGD